MQALIYRGIKISLMILMHLSLFTFCREKETVSLVDTTVIITKLAGGFKFLEGPAINKDGDVYFTDNLDNKIYKWSLCNNNLSTFLESSKGILGLYFFNDGILYATSSRSRLLVSIKMNNETEILVDNYSKFPLSGPNDLWIDKNGNTYFTDSNLFPKDDFYINSSAVYYLSHDKSIFLPASTDLLSPNGIVGSMDNTRLYVSDAGAYKVFVFNINENGAITNKTLFASECVDGMTVDNNGNVYMAAISILVYNKEGKKIKIINLPEKPTNLCFSEKNRPTLFVTTKTSFYSLQLSHQ